MQKETVQSETCLYFQSVTDGINNYSILPTVLLQRKGKKRTRTMG
jgi:hypothetical protein